MNNPADELRAEHRNFEHVLQLIDAQLKLGNAGDPEACRFMMNALTYLLQFEDGVHREKDDMLCQRLLLAEPSLRPACERLLDLRKLLRETKLEMQRCVAGLRAGNTAACHRVQALFAEYKTLHAGYQLFEEDEIMPAVAAHLREQDWWDIHERFAQVIDPIFGKKFKLDETPYDRLMALDAGTAH